MPDGLALLPAAPSAVIAAADPPARARTTVDSMSGWQRGCAVVLPEIDVRADEVGAAVAGGRSAALVLCGTMSGYAEDWCAKNAFF